MSLGHTFGRRWFVQIHGGVGITHPVHRPPIFLTVGTSPPRGWQLGFQDRIPYLPEFVRPYSERFLWLGRQFYFLCYRYLELETSRSASGGWRAASAGNNYMAIRWRTRRAGKRRSAWAVESAPILFSSLNKHICIILEDYRRPLRVLRKAPYGFQ